MDCRACIHLLREFVCVRVQSGVKERKAQTVRAWTCDRYFYYECTPGELFFWREKKNQNGSSSN